MLLSPKEETLVEWTHKVQKRRRKYRPILEEVKAGQSEHGTAWAEIARFQSEASGRACAYQLKAQYAEEGFEFRSALDQDIRDCVVYARWIGDSDD